MPKLEYRAIYDFFKLTPDTELRRGARRRRELERQRHGPESSGHGELAARCTATRRRSCSSSMRTASSSARWGKGVYGLGYAHSVRFDRYDNLWVVDKGTDSVMKFDPAGFVMMNLGRRPEGYEGHYDRPPNDKAVARDGYFNGVNGRRLGPGRQHLHQRRLRELAHREVRQERRLDQVVRQPRHRAGPVPQAAQPAGRSPGQRLCRRSRQPPHPGVRHRRQLQALHLPERRLRQEPPPASRQPDRRTVPTRPRRGHCASRRDRRSTCTRSTTSRAGSTR